MRKSGVKNSSLGREGLRYAIEEMTERKLLVFEKLFSLQGQVLQSRIIMTCWNL